MHAWVRRGKLQAWQFSHAWCLPSRYADQNWLRNVTDVPDVDVLDKDRCVFCEGSMQEFPR